jgi:hypothetical protein
MNRFAPLIRSTNDRLNLPQPIKSRVLLELAADMEDLYRHYREQGRPPPLAEEKVVEQFSFSDEALVRLTRVHASPFRRLMDGLSERTLALWERAIFLILTAFVAVLTLEVTMTTQPFSDASPLIWLVVALGAAGLIIAVLRVYALYIKEDHDVRRLRRGLDTLIGIGVFSLVIGHLTLLIELFRIARAVVDDVDRAFMGAVICVLRTAPVMNLALLVAIGAGILWFFLSRTVARIEEAEASVLLAEGGGS